MKKSLLIGVGLTALILAAPEASAKAYKPYVSVFGGAAILAQNPHIETSGHYRSYDLLVNNPGYIIGGAVGIDWNNQIRTELELSHARWGSNKYFYYGDGSGTYPGTSDVSATYLLGNIWYDLNHGARVTPYIGGGAGIGWANVNAFTDDKSPDHFSATGLAFQIGAGIRFAVNDRLSVDAGYRFKDIVGLNYPPDSGNGDVLTDTSLAAHTFQIGFSYQF
jgi:opacity protein-like surface antigen